MMVQKWLRPLMRWESALVVVVAMEILVFGALNERFLNGTRLINSTSDFIYVGILALPLAVVMLSGGIDISIGSVVSLSAITTGVVYVATDSMVAGIVAGLAISFVAGLLNGLLIVITGTAPMVITLGTQFLYAGLALGISGLGGVSSYEGISNLPEWFNDVAGGQWIGGIPNLITIFVVVAVIFLVVMAKTPFGRMARLIGMSPSVAEYAGISVPRATISIYALTGTVAGLVGVLLTSYFGSARSDMGATLLMPALTLVVIGGVSMFGGEGGLLGVVIATFVIGFLEQGLRFAGMSENQVTVVTGIVLVVVASVRWWSARGAEILANRRIRRQQIRRHREVVAGA